MLLFAEWISTNSLIDPIYVQLSHDPVSSLIIKISHSKILISQIVTKATGLFSHLVDAFRAQGIRTDQLFHDLGRCHCCRRFGFGSRRVLPPEPGKQLDEFNCPNHISALAEAVQGRCAGLVSRFGAWAMDSLIVLGSFAIGLYLFTQLSNLALKYIEGDANLKATFSTFANYTHRSENQKEYFSFRQLEALWGAAILYWWGVLYNAIALAAVGRTPGKAIMGLLVVRSNGRPLHATQALLRAMITSLVIVVVFATPLGWIRRDRRQLHDLLACTTVIYAWDVRSFRLREADLTPVERLEPTYGSFESAESWDEDRSDQESHYQLHP